MKYINNQLAPLTQYLCNMAFIAVIGLFVNQNMAKTRKNIKKRTIKCLSHLIQFRGKTESRDMPSRETEFIIQNKNLVWVTVIKRDTLRANSYCRQAFNLE